ncbi:MAG: GNAT family N-acetyltransferase [Paracoccaceae bacterium]
MDYQYQTLGPEHAECWRGLRLDGVRQFPMGFLVTPEEVASVSLEMTKTILNNGTVRAVFDGDDLVGFCGFRPQALARIKHRAEIGPFFVDPPYQGKGAAAFLMDHVIAEARDLGLMQLELFVDTENGRAITFYERQGFQRQGVHPGDVLMDGELRDSFLFCMRL